MTLQSRFDTKLTLAKSEFGIAILSVQPCQLQGDILQMCDSAKLSIHLDNARKLCQTVPKSLPAPQIC